MLMLHVPYVAINHSVFYSAADLEIRGGVKVILPANCSYNNLQSLTAVSTASGVICYHTLRP